MNEKTKPLLAIEALHIGKRGVFRVKRDIKEGVIQEVSPSGDLFRINSTTWIHNTPENIIELLPDAIIETNTPTRTSAFERKQ